MNKRLYSAHGGHQTTAAGSDCAPAAGLSHLIPPDSDIVRSVLEELDDVVFLAIRGDTDALEQARSLWPAVVEQIGRDVVEESREQYLRYATDLARRSDQEPIRDPCRALAIVEIVELLMQD